MKTPILKMSDICKSFSGVQVLKHVDFELLPGEVHVLIGENGAGKSTLMKILTGVYQRDGGEIFLADKEGKLCETEIPNPKSALGAGISMVFQEFNLMENMSIAENISIGYAPVKNGRLDWKRMNREAKEQLERVKLSVPPTTLVEKLSTADKQCVEIAKCLSYNGRIIILDEPTSSLSEKEVKTLFELIRELKAQGISIIYISHRMEEIFEIGDRITVFRDGCMIDTVNTADTTEDALVSMMIGREFNETVTERIVSGKTEVAIETKGVKTKKFGKEIDFKAYRGEIVGIFGLVGAGRTEFARVLFGIDPCKDGSIIKDGRSITIHSARDAIKNRIGMVPEDRKELGLIAKQTVGNNLTLVKLRELSWFLSSRKTENEITQKYVEALSIAGMGEKQTVERLSGGNQQKVVIAKWISLDLDVLILDEPTRGIDVKAKAEIYEIMRKLANEGKCIIMISSDLPEVLRVSHRVVVMHDGAVTLDEAACNLDQEKIMHAALN